MKENKEELLKEEAPQSTEGVNAAPTGSSWRRLMAKKWAYPAIYMAAAAIILTLMWVYQGSGSKTLSDEQVGLTTGKAGTSLQQPDALAANANVETMQWPVNDRSQLEVSLAFFDNKASKEEKQAAMLQSGDMFLPHAGIDLARKDNQAFDVLAAMSGKVTVVEKNPVAGNLVEVTHSNGLVSVYQSLSDIKVAVGSEVKKGDLIAKSGRNELEKDEGVHLHFEVRQGVDGSAVNPGSVLPQ